MASSSTIIGCLAGRPQLLRAGAITREAIESVLGSPIDLTSLARTAPNAPGQLASHYAPKAELRLGAVTASSDEAALDFGASLKGVAGEFAARSFAVRRPHRGRVPSVFLFARLGRVRRGADRSRADPRAWAWRGDQRSAPSRGRAPKRFDMKMVAHQFRGSEAASGNGKEPALRMASAEMSGARSLES